MQDFIINGVPNGTVATQLAAHNFDVGVLRPFIGKNGKSYCTVNRNGKMEIIPTQNAATLRHEEWRQIDDVVTKAARSRLKLISDMRGAGLVYNVPNGMGKTVLSTESMSDPGFAVSSMDALRDGPNDRPQYDITNLPLPITHADFSFSSRQLATGRIGGNPLDVSMAEACGRRVAEQVEKFAIGNGGTFAFGGGNVYGLTNFPSVNTVSLTSPLAVGWTGETLLGQILSMRQAAYTDHFYGPYMLYNSPSWDQYLDDDFKAASDVTLRERILKLAGIQGMSTLDYLTGYSIVLVQMTSDVARLAVGMDVTTLQWEEKGGLLVCFKVMCIIVPQVRADYSGHCGIVHGSV